MGYELKINDKQGIIEIHFFGEALHTEHLKAREELIEICQARKIHKILVDVQELTFNEEPSASDLFDFGVSWPNKQKKVNIFLAGVFPRDFGTRHEHGFGETVAANRGFYTKGFESIEEAREWLENIGE